jgi:hypothetical protein
VSISSVDNDDTASGLVSASSTKKKAKGCVSRSPTIMDDETVAMLYNTNDTNKLRMEEIERHNKFMEDLETKKENLETQKIQLETQNKQLSSTVKEPS